MRRENEALETSRSLHKNRARLAQEEIRKINEAINAKNNFMNNYYIAQDIRARKEASHAKLMEAARNDGLSTVLKAIYITAMEAEAMTDQGILLAESMVDTWIDEQGGASKILNNKVANKTYLLSRITQIVEEYAIAAVNEIESEEEPEDTKEEDTSKTEESDEKDEKSLEDIKKFVDNADKEELKDFIFDMVQKIKDKKEEEKVDEDGKEDASEPADDDSSEEEKADDTSDEDDDKSEDKDDDKDSEDEDKSEEDSDSEEELDDVEIELSDDDKSEDKDDEEESKDEDKSEEEDDSKEEDKDDSDEDSDSEEDDSDDELDEVEIELSDDEVDPDEDANEDDDIEDALGEPLDDDGIDTDITVDGDTENDGKIFDDLKKEDDVQKAIDLIRTRVADAEETFIRNNAEDKKKIDELLNKISNNVKTVEELEGKDDSKAAVAKEAASIAKRNIDNIKSSDKTLTVFEKMARILGENIVKNPETKEMYLEENGTLDVDLVIESAKVMYGFLETLNTLQLENVDEKYIAKVITDMKKDI